MKKNFLVYSVLFLFFCFLTTNAYALFSSRAINQNNTISSGNATLQIKNNPTDEWNSTTEGVGWTNLYPGWSNSFNIYFKNSSSSSISLKVKPKLEISGTPNDELLDDLKMEISKSDGTSSTGTLSFREWVSNETFLSQEFAQNEESEPWLVKFSVSNDVGNEFENSSLGFNLIFDGQQVL